MNVVIRIKGGLVSEILHDSKGEIDFLILDEDINDSKEFHYLEEKFSAVPSKESVQGNKDKTLNFINQAEEE